MKKIYTLILLFLISSVNTFSQTSISITSANDTMTYACGNGNAPFFTEFNVYATVTGYNQTDTFYLKTFFGDGTYSTSIYVIVIDSVGGALHLFGQEIHNYLTKGVFDVTYIMLDSYGNTDTLFHPAELIYTDSCAPVWIRTFVDYNSNCVFDVGDSIVHVGFIMNNGVSTYLTSNAVTSMFDAAVGYNYTVIVNDSTIQTIGYNLVCPASGFINFTHNGPDTLDFTLNCNANYDLQAISSAATFKAGTSALISTLVINTSCVAKTGTYDLTLDPNLSFVYSMHPPTSVVGNNVSWNFTNLSGYSIPFTQINNIWSLSYLNMNPSVQIGDTLCYTFSVSPTLGDVDPTNNSVIVCKEVMSAWDPNYKDVNPAGEGVNGYIPNNTELNYSIGFQNTGNATATDVYIIDTLSNNVDINTLQILFASNPMQFYIIDGNILQFQFNNIMLPDSGANQILSHGMVVYKIKTKPSLADGTTITNTANIYFDNNPAVVTNTTLNTINIALAIGENKTPIQKIYPVPANDKLNLVLDNNFDGKIILTDVLGKEIFEQIVDGDKITLDVSSLINGFYFIHLNDNHLNYTGKFLVLR